MTLPSRLFFMLQVSLKWIPTYVLNSLRRAEKPVHVFFCTVDHYEPGTGNVPPDIEKNRVQKLMLEYPRLAERHIDSSGNRPKRTWFFPPHYHRFGSLGYLVTLCEKGFGEIELHLHHGKSAPDTPANLEKTIRQCVEEYGHFGIFGAENGKKRYGFIHGDWALDNSRNGRFCGVNNEIEILNRTGCYADFTFPSLNESNPSRINSLYYAAEDPIKPKSYETGIPVSRFQGGQGDLLLIQGPLHPFLKNGRLAGFRILGDAINGAPRTQKKRVDLWVRTGIHVKGQQSWIFVKTHTHGAVDDNAVLGDEMDSIFTYLETRYDDGTNYVLHYVTAREMYNIIKAAEAGELGTDPERFRNYLIAPPVYRYTPDYPEASEMLKALLAKTYC